MYIPTAESTTDFTNDILITKPISNKQRLSLKTYLIPVANLIS